MNPLPKTERTKLKAKRKAWSDVKVHILSNNVLVRYQRNSGLIGSFMGGGEREKGVEVCFFFKLYFSLLHLSGLFFQYKHTPEMINELEDCAVCVIHFQCCFFQIPPINEPDKRREPECWQFWMVWTGSTGLAHQLMVDGKASGG